MSHLITCPKCGGTGQIKRPENELNKNPKHYSNYLETSVHEIFKSPGSSSKGNIAPYKICPECNGFGMVRG